jgi:hypothetical protein
MPTYIVTNKATGAEVTRYCSSQITEQINQADYPLADFDHAEYNEEVPAVAAAPMKITKLAFRNRFTQAEKVAIEIAALDDPAAPMQQRALAAALRANQADIQAAQYVDLNREDTRTGVQTLESVGLIATGRAEEIIDTAPSAQEVYRGE